MFISVLAPSDLEKIRAAACVSLDLETTALTPASPPTVIGGKKIGDLYSLSHYEKLFGPGADVRPRVRIKGLYLPGGVHLVFDFDALNDDEKKALVHAACDDKIIFGHNLSFDFMWLVRISPDIKPLIVIDTMLLIRAVQPGIPWKLHALAADESQEAARYIVERKGDASISLNAMCVAVLGHGLEKSWQKPHNWCVRHLSPGHYEYVLGDLAAPVEIFLKIAQNLCPAPAARGFSRAAKPADVDPVLSALEALQRVKIASSYFEIWQHMPLALAHISRRGIPLRLENVERIKQHRISRIGDTVPMLLEHIPALGEHKALLSSGTLSTPAAVKVALGAYAAENGCVLEEAEDGVPIIASKKVKLSGANELAGWEAWDMLQRSKKVASLCDEYKAYSLPSPHASHRLLHPIISPSTVTLRCATGAPNVQNLPRPERGLDDELQIRSVVEAYDGWSIISADFAQIELRIAAALALRAIKESRDCLDGKFDAPRWVREALILGEGTEPLDPAAEGFEGLRNALALAWRGVCQRGTPMAEIFRRGLDPHLLTGVGIAARKGFDLSGMTALEYLSSLDADATKALTKTLSDDRQAAKPANFGLLYGAQAETLWRLGITDYGMRWSLEEATAVRDAWMHDYCDIAFWQQWVTYVHKAAKGNEVSLYRRNRYSKEMETKPYLMRTSTTLLGRPICTPERRECLNHQDQASGSEMISLALISLDIASEYVIDVVHDELVAHCPDELVPEVRADIEKKMLAAADRLLAPWDIPGGCEVKVAKRWGK